MNFTNQSNSNYLRIPLATFANSAVNAQGYKRCNISMSYLDPTLSQSSNIILGGMFFQEFFTVFNNNYTYGGYPGRGWYPGQTAQIYASNQAVFSPYIGSTYLPTGANPFVIPPTPIPTPNYAPSWIWILCLCVLGVIVLAAIAHIAVKCLGHKSSEEIG